MFANAKDETTTNFTWLELLLSREDSDGTPKFSITQMEDFIAALLLKVGFHPEELPPQITVAVVHFLRRAGVDAEEPAHQTQKKIRHYFKKNPLNRELVVSFQQQLRACSLNVDPGAAKKRFLRFIGD